MNLNKKQKLVRIDEDFARIIGIEIPNKRIQNKVDEKQRSPREVTNKMMNHPLFPKLVEDLETFKFLDNE